MSKGTVDLVMNVLLCPGVVCVCECVSNDDDEDPLVQQVLIHVSTTIIIYLLRHMREE